MGNASDSRAQQLLDAGLDPELDFTDEELRLAMDEFEANPDYSEEEFIRDLLELGLSEAEVNALVERDRADLSVLEDELRQAFAPKAGET